MSNIDSVIARCSQQVPVCHLEKSVEIDSLLQQGIPYTRLQGARIKQSPSLIRFKLGRNWRLLYSFKGMQYVPICLISRQNFENKIKRR